jgi:carbonic anhydrase
LSGGEAATIEFAVAALGVKDIILCGYSHCGAIQGLLHPEKVASLPAVSARLSNAEMTRRIIQNGCSEGADNSKISEF